MSEDNKQRMNVSQKDQIEPNEPSSADQIRSEQVNPLGSNVLPGDKKIQ